MRRRLRQLVRHPLSHPLRQLTNRAHHHRLQACLRQQHHGVARVRSSWRQYRHAHWPGGEAALNVLAVWGDSDGVFGVFGDGGVVVFGLIGVIGVIAAIGLAGLKSLVDVVGVVGDPGVPCIKAPGVIDCLPARCATGAADKGQTVRGRSHHDPPSAARPALRRWARP